MHELSFDEALDLIFAKDTRFKRDGYLFVKDALNHTQKAIGKKNRGQVRHVTGQELLEGIREYALSQYGPMTTMLLREWGIKECRDFGEMVFNMVEVGWLAKTETDSLEDFDGGYNFSEAFQRPFLPAAKQAENEGSPMREKTSQTDL
jgi:uncharacterized repeat protein (TIGR04138 family)